MISAQATAGSAPPRAARAAVPLRTRWALLTALAGGLLLAAAFPPTGAWPLAVAGPALLAIALCGRSLRASFCVGLIFGVAFFFPLLSWTVNVAWYAWTALAAASAVIFGVLAIGQRLLLRLPGWPVAVAGWWVAAEAVRDRWPWGGFPWGRLAMSQAGAPTQGWAAIGGTPLLTFVIALVGAVLGWLVLLLVKGPISLRYGGWRRAESPRGAAPPFDPPTPSTGTRRTIRLRREGASFLGALRGSPDPRQVRARWRSLRRAGPPAVGSGAEPSPVGRAPGVPRTLLAWLVLVGTLGLAVLPAALPLDPVPGDAKTAEVAAIQGNVPRGTSLAGQLNDWMVTLNHVAATDHLAQAVMAGRAPAPDLVIWPENSTDIDPTKYPPVYQEIASASAAIGRPILVGAVLQYPERNAGLLWLPGKGPVAMYVKRRLVPFGEVIPFRSVLSKITSLTQLQPVNLTAGHSNYVFHVGQIKLGDVICYEIGFDDLVRSDITDGANLLTMQTNDATFERDGQTGETGQQLDMARLRAVEHDRAVVVASTTGYSAIIAPDGRLIASSGTWRQAELEARVPLLSNTTLADRVGPWPEYVIAAATLAACAASTVTALRGRRRRTASAGAGSA